MLLRSERSQQIFALVHASEYSRLMFAQNPKEIFALRPIQLQKRKARR